MESGQRASRRESYRIADLTLDAGARLVHRGPETLPLPPLSFDLLLELARAYPDALTIDELVARVWRGRVVSQATVAKRVELLRQALGDDSAAPRYVMLVRGHGYRLVDARPPPAPRHPLRSWRVPLAAAGCLPRSASRSVCWLAAIAKPPSRCRRTLSRCCPSRR